MPRISLGKSAELKMTKEKGMSMFKWQPGNNYHVIFLAEQIGEREDGTAINETISYKTVTHSIASGKYTAKVRCANSEKYAGLDPESVVRRDANGDLLKDPRTGKVLNDGTCPYCEARQLYEDKLGSDFEVWEKEHPGYTPEDRSKFFKKGYNSIPVSDTDYHNAFIVAVVELENGKPKVDKDGNKQYQIVGMEMSQARFKKLLLQADIAKMDNDYDDDDGLSWREFYFIFPEGKTGDPNKDKQESGKNLEIALVRRTLLDKDESLFNKLKDDVANLDFDEIENKMYAFKLKTLEEMHKDMEGHVSVARANMTDEEVEEAKNEVYKPETLSKDEIQNIMGSADDAKGSEVFSESDIDSLL